MPKPRKLPDWPVAPSVARHGQVCAVCGSDRAWWGFAPPLVPELAYACAEHLADVDPALAELPDWLR